MGHTAVVGIGPGDTAHLTYRARQQIEQSDILIGAPRMLAAFDKPGVELVDMAQGYDKIVKLINKNRDHVISVLAAGDVGFYSIGRVIREKATVPVEMIPGISSLQYFSAQIGESWQDMAILSLHGRSGDLMRTVFTNSKTFLLLGNNPTASEVCKMLGERGLGDLEVVIGERLSYPEERIVRGKASELQEQSFDTLAVMLIYNPRLMTPATNWHTPGIPDDMFIRGDVPMTKEVVRATSVCKLRLSPWHVVYDIGAGTGSVAIECALQARYGQVFALERDNEACDLIRQNARRFGTENLQVIETEAPQGMDTLPPPDRVFIGGAGGRLKDILDVVLTKNPRCRIVINAIMLETVTDALQELKRRQAEPLEIVQLSTAVNRPVPSGNMMLGQNPIYIISAGAGQ